MKNRIGKLKEVVDGPYVMGPLRCSTASYIQQVPLSIQLYPSERENISDDQIINVTIFLGQDWQANKGEMDFQFHPYSLHLASFHTKKKKKKIVKFFISLET